MYDSICCSRWNRSSSSSSWSTARPRRSERNRRKTSLTIASCLYALDDLGDDGAQFAPGRDLLLQARAPAFSQLVVFRAPVVVRRAPRRFDPSSTFEPMQGGIEGPLSDVQGRGGDLMETLRDRPAMPWREHQCFQNEE